MEKTDALGRRRRPTQNRGLRPLYPKLPGEYRSRLLRLAMSWRAWERLDGLVAGSSAPTLPRAYGEVVEGLLERFDASPAHTASAVSQRRSHAVREPAQEPREDWQVWQIQKELALLAAAVSERWRGGVGQESMT